MCNGAEVMCLGTASTAHMSWPISLHGITRAIQLFKVCIGLLTTLLMCIYTHACHLGDFRVHDVSTMITVSTDMYVSAKTHFRQQKSSYLKSESSSSTLPLNAATQHNRLCIFHSCLWKACLCLSIHGWDGRQGKT